MNPPLIQLFLKAPRPGTVKTRLAATVGDDRAVEVYRALVERQLAALPEGWGLEIHYAPKDAAREMREWLGTGVALVPQCGGDLGARLSHAVRRAFQNGAGTVFCIGGDCPGLGPGQFEAAREILDQGADLVFGPAEDGGYYLVGQRCFMPQIFENVPWSTSGTLAASLKQAVAANLVPRLLETLLDVDTVEDWKAARAGGA